MDAGRERKLESYLERRSLYGVIRPFRASEIFPDFTYRSLYLYVSIFWSVVF